MKELKKNSNVKATDQRFKFGKSYKCIDCVMTHQKPFT